MNHTSLKTVLHKFKQIVDFKTRRDNMLDLVITNSPNVYKDVAGAPSIDGLQVQEGGQWR